MDEFKFLHEINNLQSKGLSEADTLDIYEKAEQAFESLKEDIEDLRRDKDNLEERVRDLKDELTEAQNEIDGYESEPGFLLEGVHDNIITAGVIESLFENLDDIPVLELEKFINQYKK